MQLHTLAVDGKACETDEEIREAVGIKMRKEPSLAKRCEKSGKDAKRTKFREKIGTAM